jgi:hypothetical protein
MFLQCNCLEMHQYEQARSVLECSCCKIHRYVAAPSTLNTGDDGGGDSSEARIQYHLPLTKVKTLNYVAFT